MSRSPDSVEIADKDAIIYKLREHVNKLEEDKTNLTDQLIEVLRFEFSLNFYIFFVQYQNILQSVNNFFMADG